MRVFFQNIKGLSHSHHRDDYDYYMAHLTDLNIDVAGLSETNTAWQHPFLRADFTTRARKAGNGMSKTSFGSPDATVDRIPPQETFQAGGSLTVCFDKWTTGIYGPDIQDKTGLGRWSGLTFRGKHNNIFTLITAYRTCAGTRQTAPLGSTFHREAEFLKNHPGKHKNPRIQFLHDMRALLLNLRGNGHSILLMMDANSTLEEDNTLLETVNMCGLYDLHHSDPAKSTYIGAESRRIDFMFGCKNVLEATTRSGTLSYLEGPQSDHRPLYVDLDTSLLLEYHPMDNAIQPPQCRALKTGNPEIVARYHQLMLDYYETHNMVNRMDKIFKHHSKLSDHQLRRQLEKWDRDQGRAMRHAERALRKCRQQKYYWSPTLRNAGLLVRYWHLRHHGIQHHRNTSRTINRLQTIIQQHDPDFVFPMQHEKVSEADIITQWKKARQDLHTCQKNARDLRYQSYEDLLVKYELEASPEAFRRKKIVTATIRTEKSRDMFRQIRIAAKPFFEHSGGLKHIMIPRIPTATEESPTGTNIDLYSWLTMHPDGPTEWDTIIDRNEIEKYLLQYNQSSFRAASASPCGHGVMLDALTFSTLSPAGEDFLRGIIPNEWHGNNQLLKEFLTSFLIPPHVYSQNKISASISEADIRRGFGRWKEATSTSPSGRHLGHYKAIIQHDTLLGCLTQFMSVVIARGLSITRWQQAINIMLEKDPGRPTINRLRIIHLFEADFNFFLKLMWGSRLVRRANDSDMINTGQYGSVPGRMAIELVMLNQLSNDICRTNKINLVRFDNDASACYDRILVHLGMMSARRCGMPENAVKVHANTLEQMQYRVKTAFGVSENKYTGEPDKPLFGTGQGSGASPAVWLTLVVVLMNTLDRVTKERIRFRSPDSDMTHQRLIDAFVDDTSLAFTDTYHKTSPAQMIQQMQAIAQNWEKLLFYSGGALNLKKCSWSMLYWEWRQGRPHLRDYNATDPPIILQTTQFSDTNTIGAEIKYTDPHTSTRILGVHLNPLGDFTKQLQELQNKSNTMAAHLYASRITPTHMQTFLRTMYAPSMLYALPAVAVDEEELARVQTSMMAVALQKLGASKTTPTAIRHGPTELGGLNIIDLRTEIGIRNLKFFRDAIFSESEAGNLLLISIKYTQIEAGISENILERPDIALSYLTPTWITSLRQFMYQHNVAATLTDTLCIRYSGSKDQCIMDSPTLSRYNPQQKRDINLVRLYLQAITLSDLSTPDGLQIRPQALSGYRAEAQRLRKNWPRQESISHKQRRLWTRFISSTFLRYDRHWLHALGPTRPDLRPRHRWPSPIAPTMSDDSPRSQSTDLKAYLSQLPRWHQRLLSNYTQESPDNVVWKAFRSRRRVTIASDGGLRHGIGTLGWKIVNQHGIPLFSGSGPIDGPPDNANSTRSELGGLAAPMLLCASLARFWGMSHRCKYKWLTDSKAAISKVTFIIRSSKRPRQYPDNIDFHTAIRELHQSLGGRRLKIKWVRGHQDDRIPYEELSPEAKLNVDSDALASDHYWSGSGLKPSTAIPHFPEFKVSILINGVRYPSKIDQQLRYHINGSYLKNHLQHQYRWNEKVWHMIDFSNFGRFFEKLPVSQQIQHMKFVHNIQPIGEHKQRLTKHSTTQDHIRCPCCHIAKETQLHLLQCRLNKGRKPALAKFIKKDKKHGGNPFRRIFADLVAQWMTDPNQIPTFEKCRDTFLQHDIVPVEYSTLVNQAIMEQTSIGWIHALRGYISKTWSIVASSSYPNPRAQKGITPEGGHRIQQVLRAIHRVITDIWCGRNDMLHERQAEQEAATLKHVVDTEISRFHCEPDLMLTEDIHYCEQSLQRLLRSSASTKRRWLYRVKLSRQKKAEMTSRQPRITKFLKTDQSTKSTHRTDRHTIPHPIPTNPTSRNKTTQQLLTQFFRERAPNPSKIPITSSPPPPHDHHD